MYLKNRLFLIVAISLGLFTINAKSQNRVPWITPNICSIRANPLKADILSLKDAKTLYIGSCGSCHGKSGKGDGIAASACNPPPADHTSNYVQSETDGSLFWKISEGRGPMPSFKNTLTEKQLWELVNYIRTLKAKT